MIVGLGQQRTDRGLVRNGIATEPAETPDPRWTDDNGGGYLVTAQLIAGLIAKHYEGALTPGRIGAIKMANGEIRPDQKFYLVEFEQAGKILAARSPMTESAQNWHELMRLNMGYRIVSIPFCSYGEETDPVTRRCTTKPAQTWEAEPEREPEPEPKPLLKPLPSPLLSEETSSLILPLGIVVIIFLVMLGGRK